MVAHQVVLEQVVPELPGKETMAVPQIPHPIMDAAAAVAREVLEGLQLAQPEAMVGQVRRLQLPALL